MKRKPLTSAILACALTSFAGAATAATSMFLLVPGVPGESHDQQHQNWIDLNSLSIGVANGACTGFTVTKNLDKSSPLLSGAAIAGSTYPTMTVDVAQISAAGESVFLNYALANVVVSSVQQGASMGASVVETVIFAASTVTMTYRPQQPDGSLGAPISFTLNCQKK